MFFPLLLGAFCCVLVSAQTGVVSPLAQVCNASLPKVLCINQYAAVMPYHFFREVSNSTYLSVFGSTSVPNDTSFGLISNADFLVFDRKRGLDLLGPNPSYEPAFNVSEAVHEAPVYVASQNKLYFSQLGPPPGYLPQLVIDLNEDPPTLSEYLSDPPVYAPNGGTFHNGLIYWGASGGNDSIGGTEQRVGLRTVDPETNKSTTLLNNYFGYYFNTVDDLVVSANGDVWFTDPRKPSSPMILIAITLHTTKSFRLTRILMVQQTHGHSPSSRGCHVPLSPFHRSCQPRRRQPRST